MATNESKFFRIFIVIISIVCFLSIFTFKPIIDGDGLSYVEAIKVLQGESAPVNFVPNRILTTFLGLDSVILFSKIFGSIEAGWLVLNILFYFILNIVFYKLILLVFKSEKTAFLASLFLATNYAMISFGLDYWMDIGGWLFYVLALYFSLKYLQTSEKESLLYSALSVGVGGLFKEYAFLGIIPMAVILIYENWPHSIMIIKKSFVPALFALVPILVVYIFVYEKFDYTYATWFSFNTGYASQYYFYFSKIIEYIKSFGSLYNFLAFLVIGGAYYFIRNQRKLVSEKKTQVFILSVILSTLPIFTWPGITQRILFITVPAMIIVASFLFKKFEKQWWIFLPLLVLYIVANFTMDAFILPNFNLPF